MTDKTQFKVAIAQTSPILGNFKHNTLEILAAIDRAKKAKVDLLVFPELAICGYPTGDNIFSKTFFEQEQASLRKICAVVDENFAIIIGSFEPTPSKYEEKKFHNQALFISNYQILFRQNKKILANQDVFYDHRYYESAESQQCFTYHDLKFAIVICEDMWHEESLAGSAPLASMAKEGADIFVVINASPFYSQKQQDRVNLAQKIVAKWQKPFIYANCASVQTELIYDGNSFILLPNNSYYQAAFCEKDFLSCYPFDTDAKQAGFSPAHKQQEIYKALSFGIKSYVETSGFQAVHLGLSGGVDSALVAALAHEALGGNAITAILMPSLYSSQSSIDDALALAENLHIKTYTIPINNPLASLTETLSPTMPIEGLTEENLQARIRGLYLMAYSNHSQSLLLTTGNKSELATGYSTLYGDMCGALNPIGDLFKTEVYALCDYINELKGYDFIPLNILEKAPSAELRPNQTDQDSLPPYKLLDALLKDILLNQHNLTELVAKGYNKEVAEHILHLVYVNEFKRFQSPPILKVSTKAFGIGRVAPLLRAPFLRS